MFFPATDAEAILSVNMFTLIETIVDLAVFFCRVCEVRDVTLKPPDQVCSVSWSEILND